MKCPICGEDSALLWSEDGIQEPGRNISVEIKCGGKCKGDNPLDDPVYVGEALIDVVIKRGSVKIEKDL